MAIGGGDGVKHIVLECIHCKQNFSNLKESDQHVKETHHRIKARFQCPKCEKYFGNNQILQLHLRVHDSEDPKEIFCPLSEKNTAELQQSISDTQDIIQNSISGQESATDTEINDRNPFSPPVRKGVGLTKIRLEDCLRCDECSCIYIDENDYKKHMKNFHRTNSNRKTKQKKGCRSCCRQCNCQGNHPPPVIRNESTNNNIFRFNIKDRWTKMVSCRLNTLSPKCDITKLKCEIKPDPDGSSEIPTLTDYSHLLSQVEVKIKTEPIDNAEDFSF